MESLEKAKKIASILDEKKAEAVSILDIAEQTTLGDYFVIATGKSSTQVKALADEVEFKLGECGVEAPRREGYSSANWILLDYGDVIVHVFDRESREFFKLDKLWADAVPVAFEKKED